MFFHVLFLFSLYTPSPKKARFFVTFYQFNGILDKIGEPMEGYNEEVSYLTGELSKLHVLANNISRHLMDEYINNKDTDRGERLMGEYNKVKNLSRDLKDLYYRMVDVETYMVEDKVLERIDAYLTEKDFNKLGSLNCYIKKIEGKLLVKVDVTDKGYHYYINRNYGEEKPCWSDESGDVFFSDHPYEMTERSQLEEFFKAIS